MYILKIDITLHYGLGGRKQLLLMGVGSSPGIGAQDICGPLGCNVLLGSHLPSPASITPHLWCWVWPGLIIDILGPDSPWLPLSHNLHTPIISLLTRKPGLASCQQRKQLSLSNQGWYQNYVSLPLSKDTTSDYSRIRIMINVGAQGSWVNLCRRCMWSELVWPPPQERE